VSRLPARVPPVYLPAPLALEEILAWRGCSRRLKTGKEEKVSVIYSPPVISMTYSKQL
jgi:hypothetical protein